MANSKRNAGATDADATGSPNDNVRAATIERARWCCVTVRLVRFSVVAVGSYSFRARIFARFAVTDANDFGTRSNDPPPTNERCDRRPYVKRLARDKTAADRSATATVQKPRPYDDHTATATVRRPYSDRDRGHRRRVGDADVVPCRAPDCRRRNAAGKSTRRPYPNRASKFIQNKK